MTPFNFLMAIRDGLREMIRNEKDPKAHEFFRRVGKMTGVKEPAVVPARRCIAPLSSDDGTEDDCRAKQHCVCQESPKLPGVTTAP